MAADPATPLIARLEAAIADRVTPAAVVEVGRAAGPIWTGAFGRLTYDAAAPPSRLHTVFDLASLTKVIVTLPVVMDAVRRGRLAFDTPVRELSPSWMGSDRSGVMVRHLLDHSSGLPAHARLWTAVASRDDLEAAIGTLPLEAPPGSRAVYSDMGFLLLGFILERLEGCRLDALFESLGWPADMALTFMAEPRARAAVAPTEFDTWRGRLLQGEVHDENAARAGGIAGHAGLFGTAAGVGTFARLVLRTLSVPTALGQPEELTRVVERSAVPGSSRALGWDTMLPTSSCGPLMSAQAIGHTGFTGTSLWIDPGHDAYVVLLTNRVHPTRDGSGIQELRRDVHTLVMTGFFGRT